MVKRRVVAIVTLTFVIVGLFVGLGSWYITKYFNSDRTDKINKFNLAVKNWNEKYRAEFEAMIPQSNYISQNITDINNTTAPYTFYLGVTSTIVNTTRDNSNTTAFKNETIVAYYFDMDTTPDSFNDSEHNSGVHSYSPLKFVIQNPPFFQQVYASNPNEVFLDFWTLPQQQSPQVFPVDDIINSYDLYTKIREQDPTIVDELTCTKSFGVWSVNQTACFVMKNVTEFCMKVAYTPLTDDTGKTTPAFTPDSSYGGDIGCYVDALTPFNPEEREAQYKIPNGTSPNFIIRHYQDPLIVAYQITNNTLDFGPPDNASKIYAIAFYCCAGFIFIIGIVGVALANRPPKYLDPFYG
jgi:hypothetical protein